MENEWTYDRPPSALELVQNNIISNVLRVVLHVFVRLSLGIFHHYRALQPQRLRDIRAKILVANHTSHLDTLVLLSAFPLFQVNRARTFAAKDYFFTNPVLRSLAFFFANAIPIDRQGWGPESLSYAGRVLTAGGVLIIFPEGTRSLDGEIHAFRPGVGRLALKYRAGIVPVYIDGTYACQPKGRIWPRPCPVCVLAGPVLDFSGWPDTRESWDKIALALETAVKNLKTELGHV